MDPIIIHHKSKSSAEALLGSQKFEWRLIDGAHTFPIEQSGEVVRGIRGFGGFRRKGGIRFGELTMGAYGSAWRSGWAGVVRLEW